MMRFSGKTAIVTGACKGIGRAVTTRLAAEGADIAIIDIDSELLSQFELELKEKGSNVISVVCDVSNEAQVNDAIEKIHDYYGHIDVLINNAGIYRKDVGLFAESESRSWKEKIEVNILGTMYFTRAVLPEMLERKYGRIVNIGSVAGVYGKTEMTDYSMTKGAVISFTRALAKEVTEQGVTVNCVSPGNIMVTGKNCPELSFMNRSGSTEECANVIVFLASDEASFVSGQNYQVDGCRKKM